MRDEMLTMVFANKAFDVNVVGVKIDKGLFKLAKFVDDVEYCDLDERAWVCSVGRDKKSGEIFASTDFRFNHHNSQYDCLFLR